MQAEASSAYEGDNEMGRPSRTERWLFVGITLVSVGYSHLAGSQVSDTGSLPAEIIWALAYALAIVGIIARRDVAVPLIRRSLPLLLIVAIAILSTLWSYDPLLTLRRAFGLFGTTAIAFYIASRYTLAEFLDLLVLTISAVALISIVLIVFIPGLGVMQERYQGAWQGLFWEKNRFGETMALGVITMLAMLRGTQGRRRSRLWISIAVCTVLVLGSRSATPIVGLLAVLCCLSVMFRLRRKRLGFASFAVGSALAVSAFCANVIGFEPADALSVLGRDATLTGRTEIWDYAIRYINERPLLGYGYNVFWEETGPVKRYLMKDLGWEPASAHNGYLEVALNFGVTGFLLFAAFLLEAVRRALRFFSNSNDSLSAWPVLVIASMAIMNLADANFVLYNEVLWLAVMVAFLYATAGDEHRGTT